jgi:hypothetical protein
MTRRDLGRLMTGALAAAATSSQAVGTDGAGHGLGPLQRSALSEILIDTDFYRAIPARSPRADSVRRICLFVWIYPEGRPAELRV